MSTTYRSSRQTPAVQRGELYRYALRGTQERTVLLVAAQHILDDPRHTLLYAIEVTAADPQHLLAIPITIGAAQGWLDVARDLVRVYRGALVEAYGRLTEEQLHRVDLALRAALDL